LQEKKEFDSGQTCQAACPFWEIRGMSEPDESDQGETLPFIPVVSRRLYQQVAERIRKRIHSGAMAAGDRLPAEKELAQQLGVSRPTVREALIALEIAGLIEIRTGSGSYICNSNKVVPATLDVGPSPLELLHARLLIEGEVAAEAAIRATERDLDAIEGTVEDMRRIIESGDHAHAADRNFHVLIATASRNRVLAELVSNLWQGMFSPIFYKLSERTGLLANQGRALAEHKAILAALQTHDAIGARAAMRCHLKSVEKVLMKSGYGHVNNG
jgi:DNA-binding FadR family transcriptional regulator